MSKPRSVVFALLLTLAGAPAIASANWYSGDPYTAATAWPQFTDNLSDASQNLAMTFDNFNWPGGNVGVVGGHFHNFNSAPMTNIDTAYWEIRTGMAHNVPGTLLHSGNVGPAGVSNYPTGFPQGGWPVAGVDVDVVDFNLPAGSYWFGLAIGTTTGTNYGWFVASTTGANGLGGPLGDDVSIYFQSNNNVISWNYVDSVITNPGFTGVDPSYWMVDGPVPEPASLGVIAAAAALFAGRRCRAPRG
jgi:hypothetical protein